MGRMRTGRCLAPFANCRCVRPPGHPLGRFESHHCSCGGLYGTEEPQHVAIAAPHPLYHVPRARRGTPDDLVDVPYEYAGWVNPETDAPVTLSS